MAMNGSDKASMNTKTGPAAASTSGIPSSSKALASAVMARKYNRGTPTSPNVSPQTGYRKDLPGQR